MDQVYKRLAKWIVVIVLCVALAACTPASAGPDAATLAPGDPLRATLSALQTAVAEQTQTPAPQVSPTGDSAVPLTGGTDLQSQTEQNPLPEPQVQPPVDTAAPLQSETPGCQTEESKMVLTASKTKVKVGETVEIKVTLSNTGCLALGLPQYRLVILNSEARPMFDPNMPDPVMHSLAVSSGESDVATFTLKAVNPGKATLNAMASFEVHKGYPGPAYWGASSSSPLMIVVEP